MGEFYFEEEVEDFASIDGAAERLEYLEENYGDISGAEERTAYNELLSEYWHSTLKPVDNDTPNGHKVMVALELRNGPDFEKARELLNE